MCQQAIQLALILTLFFIIIFLKINYFSAVTRSGSGVVQKFFKAGTLHIPPAAQ